MSQLHGILTAYEMRKGGPSDRREAAFKASGKGSELFEQESGGHRFQRVPPNEKHGRRQTSTITIAVLPIPTEVEVQIRPQDLEWAMTRGSGPGGQNRNKLETAVILKHKPSGIVVRCESERSQEQNKRQALERLRSKLWEETENKINADRAKDRKAQVGSGMRADKIRTIRYQDGLVTDHITGKKWELSRYLKGEW